MSLVNHSTKEITAKIVYYGPGRCGKTTNLQYVFSRLPEERRGKIVSLATEKDRTLFFDFLPLDVGPISGFQTRFQLYTVPGQVYYNATRRLVLQGADGVVFCAHLYGGRAIPDGTGGTVVAWMDHATNARDDIYAQRLDRAGQAAWNPGGVALCTAQSLKNPPELCADGSGGAIVAWADYRSGLGLE